MLKLSDHIELPKHIQPGSFIHARTHADEHHDHPHLSGVPLANGVHAHSRLH